MGGPVYRQPSTANVRTLEVDVGNQELWPMNWQVLGRFPKIDELHFNQGKRLGVPQHIAKSLSCSIMSFQGTSLVFSGWKMSERPKVDTVVSQLRLEAITSVFVDQSPLCFKYGTSCGPLFPNLRKVKYSGSRWTTIPCANRQGFQDISQSRKTGYYWHSVTLFYHQDAASIASAQIFEGDMYPSRIVSQGFDKRPLGIQIAGTEEGIVRYWPYKEILPDKCKSILSTRLSGIWKG
jgi:hypothetical protein